MSNAVITPGLPMQSILLPARRRTFPLATALLVLTDAVALELALLCGVFVRLALSDTWPLELSASQYWGLAAGILTILPAIAARGLYPGFGLRDAERLRGRVFGVSVIFAALLGWNYFVQVGHWSRGVLLLAYVFSLVLPPLLEMSVRDRLAKWDAFGVRVAILGAGRTGRTVARLLGANLSLGLKPIAFYDDDSSKWGTRISGLPVYGPLEQVEEMRETTTTVIVAMPELKPEATARLVARLNFPNVILVPDLAGMQSLWVNSRDLDGLLGLQVRKNLCISSNRLIKRVLDIVVSLPLALIAFPLIGVLALIIKAVSPGPAFYRQLREGHKGRLIAVWKLRTMQLRADELLEQYLEQHPEERVEWERHFKLRRDPRIIPGIGRLLRRFSLDELPQIWSVLQGEMSLIGPRPFPEYHLERFNSEFRRLRASVMPGISGMWQISSRSDGDLDVQEAQDTYYIRNWSVWLDLHILLKTVHVVFSGRGAY